MAAVQPAPTVTTSTFLCTVTVTASLVLHAGAADRQDHVLVGVLPCVELVHVEDSLRRSREVGGADLLLRVGALRPRVADEAPADHVAVAAVYGIREHTLGRVAPQ